MEKDILGNKKIAVVGAGHMGRAIIKGLVNCKKITRSNIFVSNKSNNILLVQKADYILIAVKPFSVKGVLQEIKSFTGNKIILSVAAGVGIKMIEKILGKNQKIIRLMPNIPVSENKGVIGFFTNKNISSSEKNQIKNLISILGKVFVVNKEKDIDFLTLITGCGPAISSYFINLISDYAIKQGFLKNQSINLSLNMFKGTINYLENNNLKLPELIKSVTTKGGVTEVILSSLNKNEVKKLFGKSMDDGYHKIQQIKEKIKLS